MGENAVGLQPFTWPASRLGEAIEHLAQKARLATDSTLERPAPPRDLDRADEETLGQWIAATAGQFGLEAELTEASYAEATQLVQGAGPAILRLPAAGSGGEPRFLALLQGGRRRVSLLGPDLSIHPIQPQVVRDALCQEIEAPYVVAADQFLADAGVPEQRRTRARQAILDTQLGSKLIAGCWRLRQSPATPLWRQVRQARLVRPFLALVGGYSLQLLLTLVAWWMIGQGALAGRFDRGWLLGWALLLLTIIPFQMLVNEAQGQLAIGSGAIFKQRLLYGALQLQPEEIRHQGAGQFLGRVMESEAVELLALTGGLVAVLAVIQLGAAAAILALGVGGWLHALLLLLWLIVALALGWRYLRRSYAWVDAYREMTNDLVERLVGHRTRLVQEDRSRWHDEEDKYLDRYLKLAEKLDRAGIPLNALILRGWMVVGLAGLAYAFVLAPGAPAQVAVSLGGILLARQALASLVAGMQSIVGTLVAWKQVSPLFQVAARSENAPSAPAPKQASALARGAPMVVARDLNFRYGDRSHLALQACSLQIRQGDRLLLEGPSGSGKSTLAACLAGLRLPTSGLLLLQGLDRRTLGATYWRRRVVIAPQFHENHVFTGSLAFNLLMGRRWPPRPEDMIEAEWVCRELGLGDLLDRMPAGLQQMVGESGWLLSHGESSRLYIARAILQQTDLAILDESFGALDPENLYRALNCAIERTPTLMVIAHP